jgi:hypothetical protein
VSSLSTEETQSFLQAFRAFFSGEGINVHSHWVASWFRVILL